MTLAEVQSIADKGLFPGAEGPAQLIETHANWILLAEAFAYKIKKPVSFSFLDYSTLEKRKFYCEEEVRLNNRLTSGIYLGVLPVCATSAGPVIGDTDGGEPVDYAVQMRRLDGHRQMNLLIEKKQVTPRDMQAIARVLAAFHRQATHIQTPPDWKRMFEDFEDLGKVQEYIEQHAGPAGGQIIEKAIQASFHFLQERQERLDERTAEGFFVDGHGDLHCGNIFLLENPVLFDCIEFNPHFRQVDVLDELAFLAMDLEYHGAPHLASSLINAYLGLYPCMPHPVDQRLFTYFKGYRANVRLKVTALRGIQHPDQPAPVEEMARYLQLLEAYTAAWEGFGDK